MAGNRSRFSKLSLTSGLVFAVNFTNRKNQVIQTIVMLINKSQAILKRFIDLTFSVWFTLGSEDETMFCDTELFSG